MLTLALIGLLKGKLHLKICQRSSDEDPFSFAAFAFRILYKNLDLFYFLKGQPSCVLSCYFQTKC